MAAGVLTLPPLGDLRIDGSPTGQLVTSSPVEEGGAQLGEAQKLGTGEEREREVRSEDVEAYEQKIQAALSAEITEQGRAKAQETLVSFLLHNPSEQWVRTPCEKDVVANAEAVEKIVTVLADAGFPGAPEAKDAVAAVGVSAVANSLSNLFQKVHDSLPPLTVSVEKTQHHFTNRLMAGYQSPGTALTPSSNPAKQSGLPPLIPRGPTTPPDIPRSIGVCILPAGGDLIDGSSRGQLVTSSPVEEGGAQLVEAQKLGTGEEGEQEVRPEDVAAYEQKIQAALSAEITEQGRAKAQETLVSFLLHNPSQQWVRTPCEKDVVANAEAVEKIVTVLADAGFPGAPEANEAVAAVGVYALANSLSNLFRKVHDSLPLLTVSVEKTQHHFTSSFMADYLSPEVALTPSGLPPKIVRGPPTPPVIPRSIAPGPTPTPVIARGMPKFISRGPTTPPVIPS